VTAAKLASDAVTGAKIADDAIDSEHYTDGSIDLAHMSSESVDEDNLHISNAGSNGQFLSKQSGNAGWLTWASAGGAWNLIGTAVASNTSSLTITGIDSTYDTYAVVISDMVPVADSVNLWMRLGDSGGIDSGTDYIYHSGNFKSTSASYAGAPSSGDNVIILTQGVGNATGEGVAGTYYLGKPADGSTRTLVYGTGVGLDNAGECVSGDVIAAHASVITHDRVQIFFASGNIASGRLSVFGISHL
jgi:hypothetical protein